MTRTARAISYTECLWWSSKITRLPIAAAHQSEYAKLIANAHVLVLASPTSDADHQLIRTVYGEGYETGEVSTYWGNHHRYLLDTEGRCYFITQEED